MLEAIIDSPFGLSAACAALAAMLVSLAYMSPLVNGPAAASFTGKVPLRSLTRTAMVVFVVLLNAASLGLAHRFPLGSDLIVAGFLLLLFAPAEAELDA